MRCGRSVVAVVHAAEMHRAKQALQVKRANGTFEHRCPAPRCVSSAEGFRLSDRSVIYIALSTLVGAACGTGALSSISSTSRPLLIIGSLVGGFGAQVIVTALLRASLKRIEKLGGE